MKKISLPFVLFLDVYVRRVGGYSSRNNSHVRVIARCNSMCEGGCHGNAGHLSPHSPSTRPPPSSSHNADNLNPPRRNALSKIIVSFVVYVKTQFDWLMRRYQVQQRNLPLIKLTVECTDLYCVCWK